MDQSQDFYNSNQNYPAPVQRARRGNRQQGTPYQQQTTYNATELFDDMSTYNPPQTIMTPNMNQNNQPAPQQPTPQQPTPQQYTQQQQHQQQFYPEQFPGQNLLNDPMANMAMQYGSAFVPAGKEFVEKKLDHFLSMSKLKNYFAVDTAYVIKKLGLLVFPFAHKDWSIKYDNSEPVPPRNEINVPDLYIPSMAFVTYVLVCSLILGTQERFTPEQLGMTASSALVWLFIEMVVIIGTMYVIGISSQVRYLDMLAFCGYKYVGMILSSLSGLLFKSMGYYGMLLWTSFTTSFFLARALRVIINMDGGRDQVTRMTGSKRRLYILLFISLIQPVFMYFLTKHLIHFEPIMKGGSIPSLKTNA